MATFPWNGTYYNPDGSTTWTDYNENLGYLRTLSFNKSFHVLDEFDKIFVAQTTIGGGSKENPPFLSGFMFANDYELITYG